MNQLYYGDCLHIMQEYLKLGSVDLIYLDPPWNSDRSYNAIYRDSTGMELPDQVQAFCDIWELTPEREAVIRNMPVLMAQAGVEDSVGRLWELWLRALRHTQPRLLAYLLYMTERLLVMKGILKPTGSIYLHCDPTASHYIKILMDAIFGHANFRNEIVWDYSFRLMDLPQFFNRKHDIILFYARGKKNYFKMPKTPWTKEDLIASRKQRIHIDENGDEWIWMPGGRGNSKSKLRRVSEIIEGGKAMSDVWQLPIISSSSKERIGYPTQKPLTLLRRIIETSSKPGDVVLDPFCGCATTIAAAHELGRCWIGIDIAYHAIRRVSQLRLSDHYGLVEGKHYTVSGIPLTLEAAKNLWRQDKYHFQRWAIERVNGFVTTKRTADGGIDGRLYFTLPGDPSVKSMIIEVKGGKNVGINVMRSLRGTLERDEATMAGLITMEPLSDRKRQNFMIEASDLGMLDVMGVKYPRMQVLSVADILEHRTFLTPTVAGRGSGQGNLPLSDTRASP